MYCVNCGQQLPETAKFCLACGVAQASTGFPEAWEECEIVYKGGFLSGSIVAETIGQSGRSVVAKASDFNNENNNIINRTYIDDMVDKLVADGWEALT